MGCGCKKQPIVVTPEPTPKPEPTPEPNKTEDNG